MKEERALKAAAAEVREVEEEEEEEEEEEDQLGGMTLVVSASTDGVVKIWDAASGAAVAVLRGHSDVVWHLRALPLQPPPPPPPPPPARQGLTLVHF
jgi:hypothetical protein